MAAGLVIRYIKVADFEAVSRLLVELGRPALSEENRADFRTTFARHVASANTASLIAERDGLAVGVLILQFRERLNWPSLEAWVPDLVVTERFHGTGVASALLRRAIAIARDRGCHRLCLESGYQRRRAHRFYEREGLTDAGKFFLVDLEPPETQDDLEPPAGTSTSG